MLCYLRSLFLSKGFHLQYDSATVVGSHTVKKVVSHPHTKMKISNTNNKITINYWFTMTFTRDSPLNFRCKPNKIALFSIKSWGCDASRRLAKGVHVLCISVLVLYRFLILALILRLFLLNLKRGLLRDCDK